MDMHMYYTTSQALIFRRWYVSSKMNFSVDFMQKALLCSVC